MSKFFLLLSWFAPVDYTPAVAVEAAYVIHTRVPEPVVQKCCGLCVNGVITHGDGHKTKCSCPETCACKAKGDCKDGACKPKK